MNCSIVIEQCLQNLHARRHDQFSKPLLQSYDHFVNIVRCLVDVPRCLVDIPPMSR